MTVLESLLKDSEWWASRDGGTDMSGEWYPVNSWTAKRRMNDHLTYRLRIYGRHKVGSFGCKPRRWSGELCYWGLRYPVPTTHPSCKSLPDAFRQADRALTEDVFEQACRFFTSQAKIECVVREDFEDGIVPYFSSFGPIRWSIMYLTHTVRLHPPGIYYTVHRSLDFNNKPCLRWSQVNLHHHGYGQRGTDRRFEHWLETGIVAPT